MKNSLLLILLLVAGMTTCDKDDDKDSAIHVGDIFTVKINDSVTLVTENNSATTVSFKKILNEGRCYKSQCELCYGSRADIQISITQNSIISNIDLSIWGCIDEENENNEIYKDTLGYRFRLLRLDPYPKEETIINQSDYQSKLKIMKI